MNTKSRGSRGWVVTRHCLYKGKPYETVLCILPSRYRPQRIADTGKALDTKISHKYTGKLCFAKTDRKKREQTLYVSYDRVSFSGNPGIHAVLADDIRVESGENAYNQLISWTDPDVYEPQRWKPPRKVATGRRHCHRVNFRRSSFNPAIMMTYGLRYPRYHTGAG